MHTNGLASIGKFSTEPSSAVTVGWIRVVCGIAAILFAIVFLFVGSFLAK